MAVEVFVQALRVLIIARIRVNPVESAIERVVVPRTEIMLLSASRIFLYDYWKDIQMQKATRKVFLYLLGYCFVAGISLDLESIFLSDRIRALE